jgi:Rrf2 family protein
MKITAQEEYGLRCLLQLARRSGSSEPVTVKQIAASEGISIAYAEKLLHRLAKAGLAQSVRGVRGGFRLKRTPEEVTVGDAVRVLGSFFTHAAICQRYTGEESRCVHNKDCGLRPVWSTVNYHIQKLLDNMPLSILLQGEREARQQIMELAPLPGIP